MKREPRNWKYKRSFKLKNKIYNFEPAMGHLSFSKFGLVLNEDSFFFYDQLFTIYRLLKKNFKKNCYIKINVSCILPYTKKPLSARMGKGKGAWKGFNVFLRKGTVLLEIFYYDFNKLNIILRECCLRSPGKLRLLKLKY